MYRFKSRLELVTALIMIGFTSPSATLTAATFPPTTLEVAASQQLPDRLETGDQAGIPTVTITIPTPVPPRPTAARPGQVRDLAVALPSHIKIPAADVDATFEFVGRTAEGAMDAPKDAQKAAWYKLGPRPGEIGNAVVAGHVDWGANQPPSEGSANSRPASW